jgi:hypothetical protein
MERSGSGWASLARRRFVSRGRSNGIYVGVAFEHVEVAVLGREEESLRGSAPNGGTTAEGRQADRAYTPASLIHT